MANPVVHFELIGPDPTRPREFYSELFGWNPPVGVPVSAAVSEETEYSFISPEVGRGAAAGGSGGGEGFAAHAIFYVGVDDVAGALEAAQRLGATVVLHAHCSEGGHMTVGHFRDPAGNLVGVARPE